MPGPDRPEKFRFWALTVTVSALGEAPGPALMQAPHEGSINSARAHDEGLSKSKPDQAHFLLNDERLPPRRGVGVSTRHLETHWHGCTVAHRGHLPGERSENDYFTESKLSLVCVQNMTAHCGQGRSRSESRT